MKKQQLKIGQEVFIIEHDLTITTKKITSIINEKDEIKYKLDIRSCGGMSEKEVHLTKQKAEITKQNFLNGLRFQIGDLLIFKQKEYGRDEIYIGRVIKIKYFNRPYTITTNYNNIYDLTDEDIILKIKNEYIENFENIKELDKDFEATLKELHEITNLINYNHESLEKDLKQKFKKQYKFSIIRKKPLFKNRFNYGYDGDDY